MPLTEGDKAQCREMAGIVADEIITRVIKAHIESCPHGKSILLSKGFVIGIFIGSGAIGGGVVVAVLKMFTGA